MVRFIDLNRQKKQTVRFTAPGTYVIFFYNLSGLFRFEIEARHVTVHVFGLYLGKSSEKFEIRTVQHHVSPESTSNLLIKGVFSDNSKLLYEGLIRLEKKAQKTHAYQKNQNLMVSKNVFVESRPYLEILADDVFCTHGSTTGRINEDQLLYASSRGLSRKNAEEIIVAGFVQDLFFKIREIYPGFKYNKDDVRILNLIDSSSVV